MCSECEIILKLRRSSVDNMPLMLTEDQRRSVRELYDRVPNWRGTPGVDRALSAEWEPTRVEQLYFQTAPGLTVVDDFLTATALNELHAFCLESAIWSIDTYEHGRLGAFFCDGFNCPLLLQIVDELQKALPNLIGRKHPLSQMWAFKYAYEQTAGGTHADSAAINVNFWIAPEKSNLDPGTGGMHVFDVVAPRHWRFDTYNGRPTLINHLLELQQAREVYVGYRPNRAVIFNSDLFHCTSRLRFGPQYEDRRINVTMLFGHRERETVEWDGRPPLALAAIAVRPPWRSLTLKRSGALAGQSQRA